MTDKLLINGPVATFRLEGSIGGKNKVLYMFGDYHIDVKSQTECTDIKAIELKDYLIKNFGDASNKHKIDFFFEINPRELISDTAVYHQYKEKYIHGINKLFQQSFNFDFKKNKILSSKLFPNVRLHYMDIRDYLFYKSNEDFFNIVDIVDNPHFYVNTYQINLIKDSLSIVSSHVKSLYDHLYPNKKGGSTVDQILPTIPTTVKMLSKYNKDEMYKKINLFLDKIRLNYKNDTVKNTINEILDTSVRVMFDKYFNDLIDLFKYITSIQEYLYIGNELYVDKDTKLTSYGLPYDKRNTITYTIKNKVSNLYYNVYMNIFVMLTDLYFIRRFLDKNYITNGIVYTGMLHTVHYVYILVKYFNFKITHHSYLKGGLSDLYKSIKDTSNFLYIEQYLTPPRLSQCSDLTGFPKMFQ